MNKKELKEEIKTIVSEIIFDVRDLQKELRVLDKITYDRKKHVILFDNTIIPIIANKQHTSNWGLITTKICDKAKVSGNRWRMLIDAKINYLIKPSGPNQFSEKYQQVFKQIKDGAPITESKEIKWMGSVPETDFLEKPITDIFIDGKTKNGPWAIMTPETWRKHGIGRIGIGAGQIYVKTGNEWIQDNDYSLTENKLHERKFSETEFVKTVNDEWDVEVLDLMIELIEKRKQELLDMYNTADPRPIVKGFKK